MPARDESRAHPAVPLTLWCKKCNAGHPKNQFYTAPRHGSQGVCKIFKKAQMRKYDRKRARELPWVYLLRRTQQAAQREGRECSLDHAAMKYLATTWELDPRDRRARGNYRDARKFMPQIKGARLTTANAIPLTKAEARRYYATGVLPPGHDTKLRTVIAQHVATGGALPVAVHTRKSIAVEDALAVEAAVEAAFE